MSFNRATLLIVLGILIGSMTVFAQDEALPNPQSDDPIERGEYLFRIQFGCNNCHMAASEDDSLTAPPTGGLPYEIPGVATVYAKNLTYSGEWSAEALETAIRYGVSPSGTPYIPVMPFSLYTEMADSQMGDLIAYLQSLEPTDSEISDDQLSFPREMFMPQVEIDIDTPRPDPDTSDMLAYGAYLANTAGCMHCHGQVDVFGMSTPAPEGMPWGWVAPPLLPFYLNDIYGGDAALITQTITTGFRPNGEELYFLMPWKLFQHWSESDLNAVVSWILSQPEVNPADNPNPGYGEAPPVAPESADPVSTPESGEEPVSTPESEG